MRRLALFSPVPPIRSGISDYNEKLLPALDSEWDVHLFLDHLATTDHSQARLHPIFHRREFDLIHMKDPYDQIVYQIGNSSCHDYMYASLFRFPGVVILHDANLHRARARSSFIRDRLSDYLNEIEYCHGAIGRLAGRLVASGMYNEQIYDRFPMLNLAVEGATGIVVHNQVCRDRVLECNVQGEVRIVPAPCMNETLPDKRTARQELGIDESVGMLAAFGFIAPGKGLESTLLAFQRLIASHSNIRFYLIGETLDPDYHQKLMESIDTETRHHVITTGFVSNECFQSYLAASDVCVNLRYPTQGEASSALLRIMAAGKPVLVPWYRQYMEIPRDCCIHVDLYPDEIGFIAEAFRMLLDKPSLRDEIGGHAARYIEHNHTDALWTSAVLEFLRETALKNSTAEPLMNRIGFSPVCPISVIDPIAASVGEYLDAIPDSAFETLDLCLSEFGLKR